MTNTQRSNIRNWANTLKSGRFLQSRGYLIRTNGCHCPLGVLAAMKNVPVIDYNKVHRSFDFSDMLGRTFIVNHSLPGTFFRNVIGNEIKQYDIVTMNDKGSSFKEIAEYLENFIRK